MFHLDETFDNRSRRDTHTAEEYNEYLFCPCTAEFWSFAADSDTRAGNRCPKWDGVEICEAAKLAAIYRSDGEIFYHWFGFNLIKTPVQLQANAICQIVGMTTNTESEISVNVNFDRSVFIGFPPVGWEFVSPPFFPFCKLEIVLSRTRFRCCSCCYFCFCFFPLPPKILCRLFRCFCFWTINRVSLLWVCHVVGYFHGGDEY